MRLEWCFLGACVLSPIIYFMMKWDTISLHPVPMVVRAPPPIIRQSVMLLEASHSYHLNLSSFEEEFPLLQSYLCTLIHEPRVQVQDNEKLVILAVKSHPHSGARRAALRQTWAKERLIDGYRLRPVFLLGETAIAGHGEMVRLESQTYDDILQWDIMEGHHNLSLKERCLLEWLHRNLPQVHFIYKGDDDEFVNTEMIVRYFRDHGNARTVHGFYQYRPGVMRNTKYRITEKLYPQERYPGFVAGGGFLYPGAAVKSLYEASQLIPVFPLDDVYFGFLALAANMTYRHDSRFYVYGLGYNVCLYKQALVVHGVAPESMVKIWREVQDTECHQPNPGQS